MVQAQLVGSVLARRVRFGYMLAWAVVITTLLSAATLATLWAATAEGKVAPRKPLLSASDVFEKLTGSDGDGAARVALGPLTTQHGTKSIPDVHLVNVENACGAHRHCAGVRLRCALAR